MFERSLLSAGLLTIIGIVPMCGQDLRKFNFNIGGGMTAPINPTAQFVELSGNFALGAGYNLGKHHSINGEFMWNGLRPNGVLHPVIAPFGQVNLYSVTTNYRLHNDRIKESAFGLYLIVGGGWYYRHFSLDRDFVVDAGVPCAPMFFWWGFSCGDDGFVATQTIFSKGNSAGGVNAGGGFTIRIMDSGWKFYVESRYNYAWNSRVPTTFVPVTFGFRYN